MLLNPSSPLLELDGEIVLRLSDAAVTRLTMITLLRVLEKKHPAQFPDEDKRDS